MALRMERDVKEYLHLLDASLKGALVAEYFFVADPVSGQLKCLNSFEV